jgi:hypothetical protein
VALANDDIEDLMKDLIPSNVRTKYSTDDLEQNQLNWQREAELPGVMLVVTMQQLSHWGPGMGQALIFCLLFSLGLVPTAVAADSWVVVLIASITLMLPLTILKMPATVSSACDDLLDQLNDISFLGDLHHKDRCTHLRHSWSHLNREQGLGFLMFETVIDKRMLAKMTVGVSGAMASVLTFLIAVGAGGTDEDHCE